MHQVSSVLTQKENQRTVLASFLISCSLVKSLCRGILQPAQDSHPFSAGPFCPQQNRWDITSHLALSNIGSLGAWSQVISPEVQVQIPLPSKPGELFHCFQQQQAIPLSPMISINRHVADIGTLLHPNIHDQWGASSPSGADDSVCKEEYPKICQETTLELHTPQGLWTLLQQCHIGRHML